jgi:hypothetical protein
MFLHANSGYFQEFQKLFSVLASEKFFGKEDFKQISTV